MGDKRVCLSTLLCGELAGKRAKDVVLESKAFESGQPIPPRYSANGGNVSPPLNWSRAPEGAREWVLLCEDPDAPRGEEPFVHWIVAVPANVTSLPEGISGKPLPPSAREAKNDHGSVGYFGPRPPPGHGVHHYHFELFAVAKQFDLSERANRNALAQQLKGHVCGYGELIGTYETKPTERHAPSP